MKLAYVDTSVWIASLEGLPIYKQKVNSHLAILEQGGWEFCISEMVLLETLYKPYQQNLPQLLNDYLGLFEKTIKFPTFVDIFNKTLVLLQQEKLKVLDAIHVAFALENHCGLFVTTDPHFKNLKVLPVEWIDLNQ